MKRTFKLIGKLGTTWSGRLVLSISFIVLLATLPPLLLSDLFKWSWAQIPFFLWLVAVLFSWAIRPMLLRGPRYWFNSVAGLLIVLAVGIALALLPWTDIEPLGLPLSNGLYNLMAFAPFEYDYANIDWTILGIAIAKVVALLVIGIVLLEFHYRVLPYERMFRRGKTTPTPKRRRPLRKNQPLILPDLELLKPATKLKVDTTEVERVKTRLVESFSHHAVDVSIDKVFSGPTVTMYGVKPGWEETRGGKKKRVKVNQILGLEKDLAVELGTASIRFEPVVSGESVVGLEIPNKSTSIVNMRSVLDSTEWKEFEGKAELPLALGLGKGGSPLFLDMVKMPHLLIAGTTGSGKSVCVNAFILSTLMTKTPQQVRMILIDPKRVELKHYRGLPHLATEVITEPDAAVATLNAVVEEMERRMQALDDKKARNIVGYNRKVRNSLPYMFIVIDELADLMLTTGKEVERTLQRLAQLGRATGIHLVVATQRPSVDVITGLIKANFPSRISFALASQADSRTILDQGGGEKLLGRGDMLLTPIGARKPIRAQGIFLTDNEIDAVVKHWHRYPTNYLPQVDILT